jgi:hypothetical protein
LLDRLDFRTDFAGGIRRAAGLVTEKLPLLGLAVAMMPVAYWAKRSSQVVKQLEYDSPWARLAQAGYGVWLYLVKMVAPFGLSAFYPRPEGGDFRPPVYAVAVIGVVGLSAAVVALRKRVRWLPAVWAAYLLILAPHLGLIRVGQTDAGAHLARLRVALAPGPEMRAGERAHPCPLRNRPGRGGQVCRGPDRVRQGAGNPAG